MKSLYEATNDYAGNSYVRCYVWADDESEAMRLARAKFMEDSYRRYEHYSRSFDHPSVMRVELRRLFGSNDASFCTNLSDDGWEA